MPNSVVSGFHHVALKCADLEKSLKMYKALGLEEFARWGEGNSEIVMCNVGDGGKIEFFADGGDAFSVNGKWQHFALRAADVDAAYTTALAAGFVGKVAPTTIPLVSKPEKMSIRIAFVIGPDGEELEFFKEL